MFTSSRNAEKTKFFINGRTFDENRNDVTVRLGDTEEWTILNEDSQYHDSHIHQTGFLVTEINGLPARLVDPYDGLRDTFSVPPTINGRAGEMKAIIPFTDPLIVGRFVFHCHVVKHEDKGMMMSIEVEPSDAATRLPDLGPVPPLALRDAVTGAPLLPQLNGKSVLVSFIAATCTESCPLTEAKFARIQELLRRTGHLGCSRRARPGHGRPGHRHANEVTWARASHRRDPWHLTLCYRLRSSGESRLARIRRDGRLS
jgi:hypothetical protein